MAMKKAAKKVARAAAKVTGRMSPNEINKHKKIIRETTEKLRKEGKFEHFRALDDSELEKKLNRTNTPFIDFMSWSSAPPGGSFSVGVGFHNPDPVSVDSIYLHLFVGPALVVPDNGIALLNVDARFNRLTEPEAFGLTLAPATSGSLIFTMKIPATVEKSNYIGSFFMVRDASFDVGSVLDRSDFIFRVT